MAGGLGVPWHCVMDGSEREIVIVSGGKRQTYL